MRNDPFYKNNFRLIIYLIAALLLSAAAWLRIDQLNHLPIGQSSDEAEIVVDGFQISRHGVYPLYEDFGHPDPLFGIVMAGSAALFGAHNFTFRFTTTLIGILTIAATYWAASEFAKSIPGITRIRQILIALLAAAALTVALGHITLSRSVYRGILQPLFLLLYIGFLLRGLRRNRRPDWILAGLSLGLAMYTYTAAFSAPASVLVVLLSLIAFGRKQWRVWLPNLITLLFVFGLVVAPLGLRFLTYPQSVLGRAQDVSSGVSASLSNRVERLIGQFFSKGDNNPQYNTASAPLLLPIFNGLFVIGLIVLLARFKTPASALLLSLLILQAIPVLATDEVPHGLRIAGEYAIFPIIAALGFDGLIRLATLRLVFSQRLVQATAAILIIGSGVFGAHQTYLDAWVQLQHDTITMYGTQLSAADWYFRPERRDFAEWLAAQKTPTLVPADQVALAMTRSWLMSAYPDLIAVDDHYHLPDSVQIVIPWMLEWRGLQTDTRHFALLTDGKIILLPPFTDAVYARLLQQLDTASTLTRADGSLLGKYWTIPAGFNLDFEPHALNSNAPPAPIFDGAVRLTGWRGPDTIIDAVRGQTVVYTLDWQAIHPTAHYYHSFLQLQTQANERLAGDDNLIWRWLFPGMLWQTGDSVPDKHALEIPKDLPPGAYRLVAGLYVFPGHYSPAAIDSGQPIPYPVTVGWLKVPQAAPPSFPTDARPVNATFGDAFTLRAAKLSREGGRIHVQLAWQSDVQRPPLDATIFVHLVDAKGTLIGQQDARPSSYPTFIWDKDENVQTDYWLDVPTSDFQTLTVKVGMYTFPGPQRLSVRQNGAAVADNILSLGQVP